MIVKYKSYTEEIITIEGCECKRRVANEGKIKIGWITSEPLDFDFETLEKF